MSRKNNRPELSQALSYRGMPQIRAGNFVAQRKQHLGDAAHPDAAYTYEMDLLYFGKQD
jgi:hypothetical protein